MKDLLKQFTSVRWIDRYFYLVICVVFSVFLFADIVQDYRENVPLRHIAHEVGLFTLALLGLSIQLYRLIKKQKEITGAHQRLQEIEQKNLNLQTRFHELRNEFTQLVEKQFELWNLSNAEKDIALLMLKGLSMKDIAKTRETNEQTIRQQSVSIYRKSQVAGKQEFMAYFLDNLFSPEEKK